MLSRLLRLSLLLATLLLLMSCGSDSSAPPASATFSTPTGTGYLRKSDSLWIINLEGSYTDMGRQYGALLKNELADLFIRIDRLVTPAERGLVNLVKQQSETRESQLLAGMAQEIGLTSDQLELVNATLLFMYTTGGCSAFAATGNQTIGGHTIAGRNFDSPRGDYSTIFSNKSILVIYNPKEQFTANGSHRDNSVAIMTQIGWIYGLTNLNSKGLYLEYNNATNSIPISLKKADGTTDIDEMQNRLKSQMDGLHQNLFASFDCDTLEELDAKMTDPLKMPAVATMTQVADQDRVWHYERSPYEPAKKIAAGEAKGAHAYDNPVNMDIFTNHFFFATWQHQNLDLYTNYAAHGTDSASRTFARLINLQNLAKQSAGAITPAKMKEIMTTRLMTDNSGGPFISWGLSNDDITYFTTVTDIANRVMHVYPNVDTFPRWGIIDLKQEFR